MLEYIQKYSVQHFVPGTVTDDAGTEHVNELPSPATFYAVRIGGNGKQESVVTL